MARKRRLKFDKEFYNMLDAEDKKHYMSQDPEITRSFKLIKQQPKPVKGPTDTPKRMPLPVWQDRNVFNRGSKLNK